MVRISVGVRWFVLLIVRGILLWLVIPFAAASWLLVHWWAQKASIAQAVFWYDQNLWAVLILVPFHMLKRLEPQVASARCISFSSMSDVKTYKISFVSELV